MSETQAIVSPALELLRAAGILCWRNQTGGGTLQGRGLRWGLGKGSADIIGILGDGRFFALEAKMLGKQPTEEQIAWGNAVLKANAFWAIIHAPADALALVKTWTKWDKADRGEVRR